MKLRKVLKVFPLTWAVIYFDTSEHDDKPEWQGWTDEVPYWLAESEIDMSCDNRPYYDPDNTDAYKRCGLVLIIKEPK